MHDIHTDIFYKKSKDFFFTFEMDWIVALAIFGTVVATFDVYWVIRLFLVKLLSLFRKKQSVNEVYLKFSTWKK